MNMNLKLIFFGIFGMCLLLFSHIPEANAAPPAYDLDKIKNTSENVSLESLGVIAQEYSIPILVIVVVLSAFSALLGLMFKPMKLVAGTLLGTGVIFYIMVNYAPQIVGILIAIANSVMSRITGG